MFSGSIVALVTPFRNGAIDFMAFEKLIKWHIESGIDGILVAGTTGEGVLLSETERGELTKVASEIVEKRVPLIVGCCSPSTFDSVSMVKQAEESGADGVLAVVPCYVRPTLSGIYQHFLTIHDNTKLPIILYNNPSRCVVGLSIDNVISLAAQARVIGIKDADTDLTRVIKIKTKLPDFKVLSSNVASLIGNLANGGDGIISVTANIAPSQMAELMRFWKSGDIKKVQVLNYPLVCLSEVLFSESNPIPVKYALYVKGLIDNELRKPLTKASDTTKNAIESITGKWKFF